MNEMLIKNQQNGEKYIDIQNSKNQKINFQYILDNTIKEIIRKGIVPTLLLHSCCAPCSSYVLEYLSKYFKITVLYYNPNIYPIDEYNYRIKEQLRLIEELKTENKISFIPTKYEPDKFYSIAKGLESEPEGGKRCINCYELRLREAAKYAKEGNFMYFTTTLSISPMKNSAKLNELGRKIAVEEDLLYLYSDFKKKNGYLRSIELSKEHNLYRQDYCGCIFSNNMKLRTAKFEKDLALGKTVESNENM